MSELSRLREEALMHGGVMAVLTKTRPELFGQEEGKPKEKPKESAKRISEGSLISVTWEGEGTFPCVVRCNGCDLEVVSADGAFADPVYFDPDLDDWVFTPGVKQPVTPAAKTPLSKKRSAAAITPGLTPTTASTPSSVTTTMSSTRPITTAELNMISTTEANISNTFFSPTLWTSVSSASELIAASEIPDSTISSLSSLFPGLSRSLKSVKEASKQKMEEVLKKKEQVADSGDPKSKKAKLSKEDRALAKAAVQLEKEKAKSAKAAATKERKEKAAADKEKMARIRSLKKTAGDTIRSNIWHYKQDDVKFSYPSGLFANWNEVCEVFLSPNSRDHPELKKEPGATASFDLSHTELCKAVGKTKAGKSFRYSHAYVKDVTITWAKGKVNFTASLDGYGGSGGWGMW